MKVKVPKWQLHIWMKGLRRYHIPLQKLGDAYYFPVAQFLKETLQRLLYLNIGIAGSSVMRLRLLSLLFIIKVCRLNIVRRGQYILSVTIMYSKG